MKRLAAYLRPYLGRMSLGFTIKFLGTLLDLMIPWMLSTIIDEVIPTREFNPVLCPDGPDHHSFRDLPSDHRYLQPAPDGWHDAAVGRPGSDPSAWWPDCHHEHGAKAWSRPACHAATDGTDHLADSPQRNPHVQRHPDQSGPDDPGSPGKCHRYPHHQGSVEDRL